MKKKSITAAVCLLMGGTLMAMSEKDRTLVSVAAETARGDLAALEKAYGAAFEAGWTVQELKEIGEILALVNNETNVSAFELGEPNPYKQFFSGRSCLKKLTAREEELGVPVYNVTFEPGCRNNWHKHTGGQMLIGVGGVGYYQARGEKAVKILPGTIVEIPANVEHWHGAAPTSWFSHLAIETNPKTNKNTWLDPVTDADCRDATAAEAVKSPASTTASNDVWDKVFAKSDKVEHAKVSFVNRFGIRLVADCYKPKAAEGRLAAIAVSGPFGAVKEQSSGFYAQTLAERGFLTIAFDPSFTGESGGEPRRVASPDINTEDFSAAVDYLVNRPDVDAEKIGIVGICGWGGLAINAAAIDPRIKATIASTMYDMTRVTANGYFDGEDSSAARREKRLAQAKQRAVDLATGMYARAGGVPDVLPADAPEFLKDYFDYYKTPRGFHPRSGNSTDGWNVTSSSSFLNARLLAYAGEIESAVMVLHGEKAHSRYFGETAFKLLKGDNKVLRIVPGANHTDLYDGGKAACFRGKDKIR